MLSVLVEGGLQSPLCPTTIGLSNCLVKGWVGSKPWSPRMCRGHLGNLHLPTMFKNYPMPKLDSFLSLLFLDPYFSFHPHPK